MTRIVVVGDLNLDIFIDRFALLPGNEARGAVRTEVGGSAATFARVAAAHGAGVTFVGAVGRDAAGEVLVRSLESAGVYVEVTHDRRPTGAVVAIRDGNERSMICSRGANDALSTDAIHPGLFERADHLHISGYAMISLAQRPAARRAVAHARERGISISLDPPPANLIRSFGVDAFWSEIAAVDWVFPNESEAFLLAGRREDSAVVDALAMRFAAGSVTLGARGALAWCGNERDCASVEALYDVDSTGAGDAYAAGFVVALLETGDLRLANRSGCAAAGDLLGRRQRE